jgi:predicted acetyltransferase
LYIGVASEHQGKGYCKRLISSQLEVIDKENTPCYLETHTEKNVEIFQKFGFEVANKSIIPKTNVDNWAMVRKPNGAD